jgi:hypothetical protein
MRACTSLSVSCAFLFGAIASNGAAAQPPRERDALRAAVADFDFVDFAVSNEAAGFTAPAELRTRLFDIAVCGAGPVATKEYPIRGVCGVLLHIYEDADGHWHTVNVPVFDLGATGVRQIASPKVQYARIIDNAGKPVMRTFDTVLPNAGDPMPVVDGKPIKADYRFTLVVGLEQNRAAITGQLPQQLFDPVYYQE